LAAPEFYWTSSHIEDAALRIDEGDAFSVELKAGGAEHRLRLTFFTAYHPGCVAGADGADRVKT